MTMTRTLIAIAQAAAVALPAAAFAQLSADEQKCLDKYNNFGRLVAQTANTEARKCIKNAGKGKEADPDICIAANPTGKVASKEAKVAGLFAATGSCTGAEPIQTGAVVNNAVMRHLATDLAHDIFGFPVNPAISVDPVDAGCQDAIMLRAGQLATEMLKTFRRCKKDGMKGLSPLLVDDSATLEFACLLPSGIPDPKGTIAKKGFKLRDAADKKCAATATALADLFSGECAAATYPTGALADCVEDRVDCRVCRALVTADGLPTTDCDTFDNGILDGSCSNNYPSFGGGAYWYVGAGSCDDVCTAIGKTCHPATVTFAGSSGTDENCETLLAADGLPASVTGQPCPEENGIGFHNSFFGGFKRCTEPATTCGATANSPFVTHRICACE